MILQICMMSIPCDILCNVNAYLVEDSVTLHQTFVNINDLFPLLQEPLIPKKLRWRVMPHILRHKADNEGDLRFNVRLVNFQGYSVAGKDVNQFRIYFTIRVLWPWRHRDILHFGIIM